MGYTLIGLGSTAFAPVAGVFAPFGAASANSNTNATEATYQMPAPAAGIISGLRCDQGAFSGAFTAWLRKNGANGYQTFTQAQPVAMGSDSVAQGDLIGLQFPSVTTPSLARVQALFRATSGHAALYACPTSGGAIFAASTTYYLRPFGSTGAAGTLANTQAKALTAGTASRLYANITSNATTATSTAGYNANGANGAQTVTIAPGLTGVFTDTTHTDAIALGDLYCDYLTVGAGGSIALPTFGFVFSNPTSAANDIYAVGPTTVAGTATNCCLYGSNSASSFALAAAQIAHGFAVTLSGMSAYVTANTTSGNSTVSVNKNGTSGPQGVVIAAGLTGWFSDTTNSTSFTATDLACYALAGAAGSITVFWLGVCETAAPDPAPGGYSLIGVGTNVLTYVPTQGWSGPYGGSMIQSFLTSINPQYQIPFPVAATLSRTIGDPAVCTTPPFGGSVTKNNVVANNWNNTNPSGSVSFLLGDQIGMNWGSAGNVMPRVTSVLQSQGGGHGGFYASTNNAAASAATTYYLRFAGLASLVSSPGAGKPDMRSGLAGTLQRLSINVIANATTAASTFNSFLNSTTVGAQTMSIGAGLTGVFVDPTHTDAVNAGDLFCGQLVVGAGGALTPSIVAIGYVNNASQASDLYSAGGGTTAASTNSFYCLIGSNSASGSPGFPTEAQAAITHGFALTASNLAICLNLNSTTAASTLVSRKNLANGNLSVAIGAGLTGWFTDTTHSDTVAATDGYCTLLTTGVGGTITVQQIGVTELAPNAPWAVAVAETGAATDTATDTAIYFNRVAEAGAATDTIAATEVIASANVAELGDAEDTIISSRLFPQAVAETGAAADTVVSRPMAFSATVHEAGAATDAITLTVVSAFQVGVTEASPAADTSSSSAALVAGVAETGAAVSTQVIAHTVVAGSVAEIAAAADTSFEFVGHLLPAGSMTLTGYAPTTTDAWWDLTGVPTIWTPLTPPPATHP